MFSAGANVLSEIPMLGTPIIRNYAFLEKLETSKYEIEYLNKCIEHDWGQRVIRLYDPDKHIIEIGESMDYVARRFLETGMSAEQVSEKTQLALSQIEEIIKLQ